MWLLGFGCLVFCCLGLWRFVGSRGVGGRFALRVPFSVRLWQVCWCSVYYVRVVGGWMLCC